MLLLHVCCAPDATVPLAELPDAHCYFYGANIHPIEEYNLRKNAVEKLAAHTKSQVIFDDTPPESWIEATKHLANESEGGARCALCFELQFEAAARTAGELGLAELCTTLTISPHKDAELINKIGRLVAERHGLAWIEKIWRKNDGFLRSIKMAKELDLFRQNYCGCVYSFAAKPVIFSCEQASTERTAQQ